MKSVLVFFFALVAVSAADAAGRFVTYTVDGAPYQGYYAPSSAGAPMVLLIHDWDGVTDYEVRRSDMLSKMGYTVFGGDRYRKDADRKSWRRFTEFLADTFAPGFMDEAK